jgi:hypothetical protein
MPDGLGSFVWNWLAGAGVWLRSRELACGWLMVWVRPYGNGLGRPEFGFVRANWVRSCGIPQLGFAQPFGFGRANSEGGSYLAAIVQMLDLHREFMLVDSLSRWFHRGHSTY